MEKDLQDEMRKKYAKIVAKAWADEDYKKNLLNNIDAVLKEEGFEIPSGLKIKIIEEPENTKIFVLPKMPENSENIVDLEGRKAADGVGMYGVSCCS